ncbi:MAG: hypothetical protein IJ607_06845 [Bacteroidaceae bacterium]|nr:hypothetical protein [Bacteroidaceae bacterium]
MEFIESYMKFSFLNEESFHIEKSSFVSDNESVKVCEAIVLINGKLSMIEAKSSSPRPGNKEDFDTYISEIGQKFIDTLLFYNATILERHGLEYKEEYPEKIKNQNPQSLDYSIYLIVHGNKSEWMPPIQDALRNHLRHILRAWNISDVNVKALNHELAQEKGLIKQYLPTSILKEIKSKGAKDQTLINQVEQWFSSNN